MVLSFKNPSAFSPRTLAKNKKRRIFRICVVFHDDTKTKKKLACGYFGVSPKSPREEGSASLLLGPFNNQRVFSHADSSELWGEGDISSGYIWVAVVKRPDLWGDK